MLAAVTRSIRSVTDSVRGWGRPNCHLEELAARAHTLVAGLVGASTLKVSLLLTGERVGNGGSARTAEVHLHKRHLTQNMIHGKYNRPSLNLGSASKSSIICLKSLTISITSCSPSSSFQRLNSCIVPPSWALEIKCSICSIVLCRKSNLLKSLLLP